MKSLYSKGPSNVPENLTKPSKNFKKKVAFAIFGLLLFVLTYFGLMIWFGYISYQQFASLAGPNDNRIKTFLIGFVVGVLAFFMFKSLFNFSKKEKGKIKYLSKEEEHVLFDFIYKLADEAGAPRPHKIIVSPRVNASVSYDLSIINLIIPSKKNLEIGLGLVNILNLGEFKAVLAHEFGHFAQRSMLFGRYVYMANQIASRIVSKRDALDTMLAGLSSIDIRIAWIGWILSILVWAVRSLIEVLFSVVVIAERALSREMEFQADLVAVSLTGSDLLINGLHKLRGADEAFNASVSMINELIGEKKRIPDLFVLQTNYIKQIQRVLNDKSFGAEPNNYQEGKKTKIFKKTGVNPPEMWATHPADEDRENNAKLVYIPSVPDRRSSWELFSTSKGIRESITASIYQIVENLPECELISNEDAIQKMDQNDFNWSFLNDRYKGLYIEHLMSLYVSSATDFLEGEAPDNLAQDFKTLYPDSIKLDFETMRDLTLEKNQLNAALHEVVTAERRTIYFRGNRISRKEIPNFINQIQDEISEIEKRIHSHDKKCRIVHHHATKVLGVGSVYHKKLIQMLLYTEHSWYNLNDLILKFQNSFAIATAGGRANSGQVKQLISDANHLGNAIRNIFEDAKFVDESGLNNESFKEKPYKSRFEEYGLGTADQENLNLWLQHLDGWIEMAKTNIWTLRNATLERLLTFEREIELAYLNNEDLSCTNSKLDMPKNHVILEKGTERKTEFKLSLWDRFLAGYGLVPMILKFIVALGLISTVIVVSGMYRVNSTIYIYNGLETHVNVEIGNKEFFLKPNSFKQMDAFSGVEYQIITTDIHRNEIERFTAKTEGKTNNFIYNVANGAHLLEYTVSYGFDHQDENRSVGSVRWYPCHSDYIFENAPESITLENGITAKKKVLIAYPDVNPYNFITYMHSSNSKNMILNHCIWDETGTPFLYTWMDLGAQVDSTLDFFEQRENLFGFEVGTKRVQMDAVDSTTKSKLCQTYESDFNKNTGSADLYYLKTRCQSEENQEKGLFLAGHLKWPDHTWLAYSASYEYAELEEWELAINTFTLAYKNDSNLVHQAGPFAERIRRIVDPELKDPEYAYLGKNDMIAYMRKLENGDSDILSNNSDAIFYYINQGDFKRANKLIAEDVSDETFMYYLVCSDGYVSKNLEDILAWDNQKGITQNTIWLALGLRIKHKVDYSDLLTRLPEFFRTNHDIKTTKDFLRHLSKNDINACKVDLTKIDDIVTRASLALVGRICLGEKTPEKWSFYICYILYISEKPYFD